MHHAITFVGPKHALQVFGVRLVGVNAENGKKLLFTVTLILLLFLLSKGLSWAAAKLLVSRNSLRASFWSPQAIHLAAR